MDRCLTSLFLLASFVVSSGALRIPCNSTYDCTAVDYCLRGECTLCATICNDPDGTYTNGTRCASDCLHFRPWEYYGVKMEQSTVSSEERVSIDQPFTNLVPVTGVSYEKEETESKNAKDLCNATKIDQKPLYLKPHFYMISAFALVFALLFMCMCKKHFPQFAKRFSGVLCRRHQSQNEPTAVAFEVKPILGRDHERSITSVVIQTDSKVGPISQTDLSDLTNDCTIAKLEQNNETNRKPAQHSMHDECLQQRKFKRTYDKNPSDSRKISVQNRASSSNPNLATQAMLHNPNHTSSEIGNFYERNNVHAESVTLIKERIETSGSESNSDDISSFKSDELGLTVHDEIRERPENIDTTNIENHKNPETPYGRAPIVKQPASADTLATLPTTNDSVDNLKATKEFQIGIDEDGFHLNDGQPFCSVYESQHRKNASIYPISSTKSMTKTRAFAIKDQDFSGPKSKQSAEPHLVDRIGYDNNNGNCSIGNNGSMYPMSAEGRHSQYTDCKKLNQEAKDQDTHPFVSWFPYSDKGSMPVKYTQTYENQDD